MWYFFGKFLYLTIFNEKSGNEGVRCADSGEVGEWER